MCGGLFFIWEHLFTHQFCPLIFTLPLGSSSHNEESKKLTFLPLSYKELIETGAQKCVHSGNMRTSMCSSEYQNGIVMPLLTCVLDCSHSI